MIIIFDNLQLKDPIIEVLSVRDNFKDKSCLIELKFKSDTYSHVRSINGFTYDVTWTDTDINSFVQQWVSDNSDV
jgi:hypothetical protein